MIPFAQSQLSVLLTPELSQDASNLVVVGGKQSNSRSPLYKTDAEESVAPFITRNVNTVQADPRRYVVIPGGGILYESGEREKLGQQDLTKIRGAESQGRMSSAYRMSRYTMFSGAFSGENK